MCKIGLAEIKLINLVRSIMNKFLSFATRFIGAAIIPAIATYAWTVQNHNNYWNRTIFAVQTVDFKILAHTLPTKLSILLMQKDTEELQRTLQSNTGRFGIVVTHIPLVMERKKQLRNRGTGSVVCGSKSQAQQGFQL